MATVLTCLTSCVKDYNKELVGKWSFNCQQWQEGEKVSSVEGTIEFDEYSYNLTYKYGNGVRVNVDGEWAVLSDKKSLLKLFDNSVESSSKSKRFRQQMDRVFGMTDNLMCITELSDDTFEAIYSPMLSYNSAGKTTMTFNRIGKKKNTKK